MAEKQAAHIIAEDTTGALALVGGQVAFLFKEKRGARFPKNATPEDIARIVRENASKTILEAEARLASHGLRVGAVVHNHAGGKDHGLYRLTRIEWGRQPKSPELWFYGVKRLKSGSFGTHEHSLCGPDGLTVIQA